jgi:predicted transcriptional regulator of viral defense system
MTNQARITALLRKNKLIRSSELDAHGISRSNIRRLVKSGEVARVARGLYRLSDTAVSENISLAEVAKLAPRGVFCLFTALVFHEFTTQIAPQVCIAIEGNAWRPKIPMVDVRIFRFSGLVFSSGIEEHMVDGVKIRVYSAAKTVADCFKMRNKIGVDVALEALREALRTKKASSEEIHKMAKICRVEKIIRPYMEMAAFS